MPSVPDGLEGKILRRVRRLERRRLIVRAGVFGTVFAASLAGLSVGFLSLINSLSQSGFLSVSSLLFSDFSSAMANFQDFLFSMMDSFPVIPAAAVVAGLIVVVWSAAAFWDDVGKIRSYRRLGY